MKVQAQVKGVGISIGLGSVLFAAVGVQLVLKPR